MVEFAPKVRQEVHALCARYGVARLELTGSAARDDFDPASSDVDFLVEFLPNAKVSAFEFVELADALQKVLGRRVDLIELSAVRNPILREAFARDRVAFFAAA